ncbi:MAG: hypothetical protein ACYTG3_18085 [Planctomycetota bacterium]
MNWYKLDVVRTVLTSRFDAETASVVGASNEEVWERRVDGNTYGAFLNWEHEEYLVPEESLVAAEEALAIPPGQLIEAVKSQSGLWLGPSPPSP